MIENLTLEQVMQDNNKQTELLQLGLRRWQASSRYVQPWFEKFVRYFKMYRSIVDEVDDTDEPNTALSYAYGIVEDLVSKISEPILQMRPPCRVEPKRAKHALAAEKFAAVCSTYFHGSRYQLEFTESIREMVICGNAWEADGWSNVYEKGQRWEKVQKTKPMEGIKGFLGKILPIKAEVPYEAIEEKDYEYPVRVGYNTRFPWIFDVFPEPGVKNVRDMHWLIEQEREVALDDLKKAMRTDPNTGALTPLFDLTMLEANESKTSAGFIQPSQPLTDSDYGAEALMALSGQDDYTSQNNQPDMSKVHLLWVWERDRVFVIANQKYVIGYQERFFHVPRIPYRLKVYTPGKEFLFGMGALEPVESELHQLSDIHELAMRNWIRIVNQMVAYDEDMVQHKDDWKPRAGGKIRVKTSAGRSVRDAFAAVNQQDVTGTMLGQESNIKGLIERGLSLADFSPGVEGTKPTHKTLGGLMEISRKIAQRTTTIRRMVLSNFQDQMWFMQKLYTQFQFDKAPFTVYGADGSTSLAEFDMWDIDTGGEDFNFIIEYDPSFGDDALMRNQMMALLDTSITFMKARQAFGGKEMEEVDLAEIMRRIFRAFGWSDTSGILRKPSETRSPEDELQMMLKGQPVAPQPGENMGEHLIDHYIQKNSAALKKGIETGKIDPKVMVLIDAHIEATIHSMMMTAQNGEELARGKMAAMEASSGQLSAQGSALTATAPDQDEMPARQPVSPRAGSAESASGEGGEFSG